MSKFCIYGIVLQLSVFTLVFATEGKAQYKSITEIEINLKEEGNVRLNKVLKKIESATDFQFSHLDKELKTSNYLVEVSSEELMLSDLLKQISSQTDLIFRRVNDNIFIRKREGEVESFVEILSEQVQISGKVTDENGEPLPGASIIEKGTTNGTTTSLDGNYSLTVSNEATITISFVGYATQEILVGPRSVIDVQMELDAEQLEEIIVVGYGTAKLKDITGSVVQLDFEESPASLSPNSNALQALRGKLSGVNIGTQNAVGETPNLLVRGQNSINGSNAPLIVLDGVIFLGDIADINPGDIANVSVLKDASAAAAYGSRSANGVIMINTKEGKTDKPTIRYNVVAGMNTWKNKFDLMETPKYLEKYAVQNNYAAVDDILFDDAFRNILFDQRVNTDWLDLVSQNGAIQDHQVSVSGRSDRMSYFFSGGYVSQDGAIVGDSYQRISVRSRLNVDVTDWLEVGIDGSYNNNDYSGIGANVGTAQTSAPIGYPYRYDGQPNNTSSNTGTALERYPTGSSITSALWGTDGTVEDVDKDDFFRFSGFALFKVPKVDGLTYRLNYATYGNFITQNRFFFEDYYIQEALTPPYFDRYSPSELQKSLTQANGYNINRRDYNYVIDNIINYNKEFGDHYLDVTLVATRDFTSFKTARWNGSNFASNGNTILGVNGLAFAEVQTNTLNIVERANIGYLARIGYTFQQKYHLNASYRRDGASVFGADKKWGNFPSIGLAWTASEESFLSGSSLLDYLKVKASYGVNGNQGVDPYETLAPVSSGQSGGIPYEFGDAPSTLLWGINQTSLANPNLGWERTTSFNGGFSSVWLDNMITLDVDFYFSKTTDQIFSRQIPIMTGFTSITSSLGQVDNNGLEINLGANIVNNNNLSWTSNLTFWRNRNIVASLYGDDIDGDGKEEDDIANNLFIGESLGAIYGYEFIGVVQETDTEYLTNNGGQAGDPMFADLDGDNIITADDRKILGFNKENFRLGFSNTLSYNNFSLYVMISGIFGGNGFYQQSNPYVSSFRDRFDTNELDHDWWTPENASTEYLRPGYIGGRYLGLQSRTFVRVQDVTLSYTLPANALSSIGVTSLKVYGTVNNPLTFTSWGGGGDPEEGVSALSGTYPVPTIYSLGLNVSF
ncbi:MAG: SusC/RagA family TonB-linked outer membrane protein [Bacteroidota bacterium]